MNDRAFYDYEQRELDSADVQLRKAGVRALNFSGYDLEAASWDGLHQKRKATIAGAKVLLAAMEATEEERELRQIADAHDIAMAFLHVVDGEMDARKARGQTDPLTEEQRAARRPIQGDGVAYGDGEERATVASGWADRRGKPLKVYGKGENITEGRASGYGVGDIARMMIFGPRNADEKRALSEGTDSAGGYTVPTRLANEHIDKLRARSVCFEAGARLIALDSDNLAIARLTGDPTVAWTAENAEITASDPTFDAVTLAPKKLACLVKVSRELLEDSVNIGAMLEDAFLGRMSEELDRALLFGSGASNQPTGLFGISGINSVSMGDDGAVPTNYDNLIDLLYEIQLDNGAAPSAFVMHPRTNRTYAKLKDANDNPLVEPEMTKALRRLITTAVPIDQDQGTATDQCSTVLTGDFRKMIVGMRRSLELRMLDQRYAEFDQVGFIATLRADVAVENPVHFAKLIGIKAA
jgi:HK97 family phage major capsid protein